MRRKKYWKNRDSNDRRGTMCIYVFLGILVKLGLNKDELNRVWNAIK